MPDMQQDVSSMIWKNPMPLGQGRRATLVVIMKAMLEGRDFSSGHKLKINEMWLAVLAGKKKLDDFRRLLDGKANGRDAPQQSSFSDTAGFSPEQGAGGGFEEIRI